MAPVPTGTKITLPAAADMHIHLRQGPMCDAVTKALVGTGVDTVYVMPNLVPPLTTVDMAVAYRDQLRALAPSINFLVTLYLSPELTPDEIRKAKKHGISGVKSYPRGVTTNSDSGIEDYDVYYPVFKAMEEEGLVLNLHGECPSNAEANITILNAEAKFLSHLEKLHRAFPKLRIVLEHATTKAAVDLVQRLGDTVACTITVHHLFLTVEDWAGLPHGFCKPVAKTFEDRNALRDVVKSGHPRFFLGTDSAPHPRHAKESAKAPAGLFTALMPLVYLAHLFDVAAIPLDRLRGFASDFGRKFYGLPIPTKETVTLTKVDVAAAKGNAGTKVPTVFAVPRMLKDNGENVEVVPFLAGETIPWTLQVAEK
ncbi:hypothetical protein GGF31_006429 [Allomyces arbusculus]|nr:hypothetical protein GGF31_006429 [Allomyces arbusculus]